MQEIGPYKVDAEKIPSLTLIDNPLSWNQWANLLVIDSPVGVGFSFPQVSYYDDETVAKDTVAFFQALVEAYPGFKGRQTILSGESYAGNYVPFAS